MTLGTTRARYTSGEHALGISLEFSDAFSDTVDVEFTVHRDFSTRIRTRKTEKPTAPSIRGKPVLIYAVEFLENFIFDSSSA